MVFPSRPQVPSPSVQVECPRCGARNATDRAEWQNPVTHRPVKNNGGIGQLEGTAIVLVSAALSFLLVGAVFGPQQDCLALALTLVVSLGIITAYGWRAAKQQATSVRVHHYECQYCRHHWSWQEGTPLPRYDSRRDIERDYQEVFGGDEK